MSTSYYIFEDEEKTDVEAFMLSSDTFSHCEFIGIVFDQFSLDDYMFEDCIFSKCRFNDQTLANTGFSLSEFRDCDLVLVTLDNVNLSGVKFDECTILGIDFSRCNKFGFSIEMIGCSIRNSFFHEMRIFNGVFLKNTFTECDFSYCDLQKATFNESSFERVNFSSCNLEKAGFSECKGYEIDPNQNKLNKAIFNLPEAQSFLMYLDIKIV